MTGMTSVCCESPHPVQPVTNTIVTPGIALRSTDPQHRDPPQRTSLSSCHEIMLPRRICCPPGSNPAISHHRCALTIEPLHRSILSAGSYNSTQGKTCCSHRLSMNRNCAIAMGSLCPPGISSGNAPSSLWSSVEYVLLSIRRAASRRE